MINRRNFLTAGAAFAALPMARAATPLANAPAAAAPIKLAISSYSYWHFRTDKVPIETVIDKAASLGVAGVDVLHRQMNLDEFGRLDGATHLYCQRLKRQRLSRRHRSKFASPSTRISFRLIQRKGKSGSRTREKCIEIAYALGIPCIRLNSGRWKNHSRFRCVDESAR
jgi:sugar phosphate isomerase/epimerase